MIFRQISSELPQGLINIATGRHGLVLTRHVKIAHREVGLLIRQVLT